MERKWVGVGVLMVCLAVCDRAMPVARDWENPEVFTRNEEAPHAPLIPFRNLKEAVKGPQKASRFYQSLSGTWKFHWAAVPEEAPAEFYESDFDLSRWDDITVPGTWQMQGFGHPVFRNVQQPFPATPPRVPSEYNPVGSYRRSFAVPKQWKDRRIFLHFEGVKSASYVWVNGQEVGYHQGGMEPAEYDVTPYLREGGNTLAVRVYRYSDGTYLEDQDMWRLAGIYRDVYLMATPQVHARDIYVTTDLDAAYTNAVLTVQTEIENYSDAPIQGYSLRAHLLDGKGKRVFRKPLRQDAIDVGAGQTVTVTLRADVAHPAKWSAEHPNLYTVGAELLDERGKVVEVLRTRTGFREVEVRDQAVYVNGMPIKFNGVNSHVHHPDTGRTMDVETMRRDLTLMKQFNINCVRTSHYPPNVEYLDLADELGMYIVDETGDEAHATIYLSERPEWRQAYIDRARRMVRRDRNHPSVVIWSAGNESGSGENIAALIAEGKRIDPSRPNWLYGGNTDLLPFEDIVGPRYPYPDELRQVGQVPPERDRRPSFMDEYLAATGNSLGHLEEYWELIRRYPRLTGGTIWDWVSPGIRRAVRLTPDSSPNHVLASLMGKAELVPGRFGHAVLLSGHDDWVELYRDPKLDIADENLTLELWVYPRRWNGTCPFITKGGNQYGLQQIDRDTLEFFVHAEARVAVRAATPAAWEYAWHHLAATYDGTSLKLYCDGKMIGSTDCAGSITRGSFPVNIGRNAELHGQEHAGELCNAVIDSVRIYAATLSLEALALDVAQRAKQPVLCLDFETAETKGEFFSLGIGGRAYGLIWPDRRVQPELWQLKKTPQPVAVQAVDLEAGKLKIINRHNFTNLSELDATWTVVAEGKVLQEGSLEFDVPPSRSAEVTIPFELWQAEPGVEYWLTVSFCLPRDAAWAAKGHEVAWEQFQLPVSTYAQALPKPEGELRLSEGAGTVLILGSNFAYTFDEGQGTLTSMKFRGRELLRRGPALNIWRAPTSNETERDWGGAPTVNGWRRAGLDRLSTDVRTVDVRQTLGQVQIEVETVCRADDADSSIESGYTYTFLPTGDILIDHHVRCDGWMPRWLPKIGMQLTLADAFSDFAWYGRGPHETYPDRKTGAKVGVYTGTVDEQFEPYLMPQDFGNKTDVRWATLTDADGVGLFIAGDELLNVSAQHFSTDNLSRSLYAFQLIRQNGLTVNIDHQVSGVGGTPIRTLEKYRVLPGEFRYRIRLRPFSADDVPATQLYRQAALEK